MTDLVKPNERVDDLLVNGLKIIQNPSAFRFGCDAVELANFVSGGVKDRAVDLGSGSGIITILLAGKKKIPCVGVEIQPEMADMSRRSIELNGLSATASIICAPMQGVAARIGRESASIVVCNPPYRKVGSGEKQAADAVAIARHEIAVTLREVVTTANELLKNGGCFYLVHQTERLAEVIAECRGAGLEPKILQILTPSDGKKPHLFMLKCKKGGATGLEVLHERVIDTVV